MGLLERYVLKQLVTILALVTGTLVGILWLTQALRQLDLLTAKRQTILVFFEATMLSLPGMLIVIAPIGLFIAVVQTLNRLNADSELIVMGASGASSRLVLKPVLVVAAGLTLFMYVCTLHLVPSTWRMLKVLKTEINADVISSMTVAGQFSSPQAGITFHVRERLADGTMLGVLVHDHRNPGSISTYLAERANLIDRDGQPLMVMQDGSVQRKSIGSGGQADADYAIVVFERYLLNLGAFEREAQLGALKARERNLTDLMFPDPDDPQFTRNPGKFGSELAERFAAPLYPIVFALMAYAAIGQPRSNREQRFVNLLGVSSAIFGIRLLGFASTNAASSYPIFLLGVFAVPLGAALFAILAITGRIDVDRINSAIFATLVQGVTKLNALIQGRLTRTA